MSEPFLGEVRMFSFDYAPRGWAQCDGQTLSITQNQALFALLGTTFGGNGTTTFCLPDLRGRTPVHVGSGISRGQAGGETFHTLTESEMPPHTHIPQATNAAADQRTPTGNIWGNDSVQPYIHGVPSGAMLPAVQPTGNGQPHENRQPYSVVNFCIALSGIFPTRN